MIKKVSVFITAVVIGVLSSLIRLDFITNLAEGASIELLVMFTANFLPYPEEKITFELIASLTYIAPKLYILIAFGDFFYDDFRISSVYVFTRKDNRVKWFLDKLFHILKHLVLYFAIITAVSVIIGFANNLPVASVQGLLLISSICILLNVTVTLVFVLLINVLSLYISCEMSLFLTLLAYVFAHLPAIVKLSDPVQHLLIKLNPVLQPVLPWHDDGFLLDYIQPLDIPAIPGFNVYWSFLVLGAYLVLAVFVGIRVVKTVEITDRNY